MKERYIKTIILTLNMWILQPVGNIFLRAIKMLVVPLVMFSLICGVTSISDMGKLGRVGGKIFSYYMLTTALGVTIALFFANLLKPGLGVKLTAGSTTVKSAAPPFIMDILVNMVPTNPVEAMVKGDMLQIIVFSIVFGIAINIIGNPMKPLVSILNQINEVLLKMIGLIMKLAPYGVFALISSVVASQGIKVLGKLSPIKFFKKFWPVMVLALSTSSSNATIPMNLDTCEKKLGISKPVASFTIPFGATVNMDGTSIMQGVAALFIAQMYGIDLSMQQQLMIILTATLASIGTAGVPSSGVVMLSMVLQQVGLPLEGVALVLSIDRLVDMARTAVNITGDAVGTLIVARSEGEIDLKVYNDMDKVEEVA